MTPDSYAVATQLGEWVTRWVPVIGVYAFFIGMGVVTLAAVLSLIGDVARVGWRGAAVLGGLVAVLATVLLSPLLLAHLLTRRR